MRRYAYLCLAIALLVPSAQAQLSEQDQSYANYLAGIFLNEGRANQTTWREEDAHRYSQGLLSILQEHSGSLGEENRRILRSSLPILVQEMARTVIKVIDEPEDPEDAYPSSLFIDSFLADFDGRLHTLAQRGGPIFPDESTMQVIKAQITSFVEEVFKAIEPSDNVTAADLQEFKESIILEMYRRADHPLRSEFKRPISPEESNQLKAEIDAGQIVFAENPRLERAGSRPLTDEVRKRLHRLWVRSAILRPAIREWTVTPQLRPSEESLALYNLALESAQD